MVKIFEKFIEEFGHFLKYIGQNLKNLPRNLVKFLEIFCSKSRRFRSISIYEITPSPPQSRFFSTSSCQICMILIKFQITYDRLSYIFEILSEIFEIWPKFGLIMFKILIKIFNILTKNQALRFQAHTKFIFEKNLLFFGKKLKITQ